jgi:hypothetical protein
MPETIFNFTKIKNPHSRVISGSKNSISHIYQLYQFIYAPSVEDIGSRVGKIIDIIIEEIRQHESNNCNCVILLDCPLYFLESIKFELKKLDLQLGFILISLNDGFVILKG